MENQLIIKRTFDAPVELVFKAWTDCKLVSQWWGPSVFTTPICKIDPRRGGNLYIVMHGPKNSEYDIDMPIWGTFQEFDPPHRLVFSNQALPDEKGVRQLDTLCTVTFERKGSKTEMTLQIDLLKSNPAAAAAWAGAEMGWNQSLDKLVELQLKI